MRKLSVHPSVRSSVKRADCDKMKESSAHIFIPYERTFILVFGHKEWLMGDYPFYWKFWAKLSLIKPQIPILIDIYL